MSGLWRSQPMQYISIMMSSENANEALTEIGDHGFFHAVDKSDPLDLHESAKAAKRRIDECRTWGLRLQRFRDLMGEFNVKIPFEDYTEEKGGDKSLLGNGDLVEALQRYIDPREEELARNVQYQRQTKTEIVHSIEHQHVLQVVSRLQIEDEEKRRKDRDLRTFPDQIHDDPDSDPSGIAGLLRDSSETDEKADFVPIYASVGSRNLVHTIGTPLLGNEYGGLEMTEVKSSGAARFHSYVCGVINQNAQPLFARMLYRVSRGNAISGFTPISGGIVDGTDGDNPVPKSVFYIMLTGQQLRQRVTRLCANFDAAVYDTPTEASHFDRKLAELERQSSDQKAVLQKTEFAIVQLLQSFAGNAMLSPLHTFELALRKEKAINITLMKCHFTYMHSRSACMIYLDGWCPSSEVGNLQSRLSQTFRNKDPAPIFRDVPPPRGAGPPPTYFRTNKFTSVYQGLVDTYGIARYQEVNPGLFTIVTFPFLFGVMYGDFGHGIALTCFASYLIYNEKKFLEQKKRGQMHEIMVMIFGGRYMLILMGLFAIYVGTIYNDCMAIPLHLFDSMWEKNTDSNGKVTFDRIPGRVYPWGIDWEWYNKKNELFFFNSLKMKMSVILGVAQMIFGVCLSACNHIYFKDKISLYFEFIPQLLFLVCTFGYMCLMIVMKWCMFWSNTFVAPNLIQTMIGMFLSPFSLPQQKVDGRDHPMQLYEGQIAVQLLLVAIALLSVPVMLFVKPIMQHRAHRSHQHGEFRSIQDDAHVAVQMGSGEEGEDFEHHDDHADGEEHSLSDLMIHQAIHTIEFVLGAVSNTASYLRLWALSLAHAQLATVFWDKMMMSYGIEAIPIIGPVVGFAAWFMATFFVLLCMDVLECFLHALRLHWVEFQNKFYKADGYKFSPFTFAKGDEKD